MPRRPPFEVIRTDADGFAAASHTDRTLVVLDISRSEIESGNISSALERLLLLSDNREAVYRHQESVLFQVGGYDDDPRELPEIPEVRTFFAKLSGEWPHWFWFTARNIGAIPLLMAFLCHVKIHRAVGGRYGTEFCDRAELRERMMDLFVRGSALFDAFGITPEEAEASATSAINEISPT